LLGAGSQRSAAFGEHELPVQALDVIEFDNAYQLACYIEIAAALRDEGLDALAAGIETRLAARPTQGITNART
jgi:hypothetical protein